MQVPGSANALMLGGAKDYTVARSVRTRASASGYFSRTFSAAPTVRTKQTLSFWVKRSSLSTEQVMVASYDGSSPGGTRIFFQSSNSLEFHFAASTSLVTSQVFRDTSAWYHIVLAIDTTQATSSDRVKIYVNGTQVTAFSTTQYPSQNATSQFTLNNSNNRIGCQDNNASFFDGYMTEMHFIDGQQLTPSSFGETDLTTGVWKPKKYAGTYGTNGFYLNFSDNSAATAAAIGKDGSGNGNNWTPNNISVTSGATYDSMTDVPTLTSKDAANYCVANPLDKPSNISISDGNLNTTETGGVAYGVARSTFAVSSGKWYWEGTVKGVTNSTGSVGRANIGIQTSQGALTNYIGADAFGWMYNFDGVKVNSGSGASYGAAYVTGDVIGVALDMDAGTLAFYKNGVSQGTAYSSLSGTMFPAFSSQSVSNTSGWHANFGQRPFAYTPPTGFVALNTFNLPEPTIKKPVSNFDVGLYTGTGSASALAVSGVANPDFVWIKGRSGASSHALYDTIRGFGKRLYSNATNTEYDYGSAILAPTATGFNLTTADADHNTNTGTYAAWQWKANGAAVSNTAGSITSSVSANASAGFSIVTYTGTGANATVGHGLGVAPKMIIVKNRSSGASNWVVYHASLTSNLYYLSLNTTDAQSNTSGSLVWNSTSPTSSVFSVGAAGSVNGNTNNHVAYCFSEVAGYSKFGSYVGNGSADGTFVHLGFRPKYIIIKRTDALGSWTARDSARDTYNASLTSLYANASDADDASGGASYGIDFLSNGFKFRGNGSGINGSGGTFIFMAFAEVPTKYALAR